MSVEEGLGDRKASCLQCEWSGPSTELVEANLDLTTEEAVLQVAQVYMVSLFKFASKSIGESIVASGLITPKDKALARLIRAATLGAHKATLSEISKMQEERADGRN